MTNPALLMGVLALAASRCHYHGAVDAAATSSCISTCNDYKTACSSACSDSYSSSCSTTGNGYLSSYSCKCFSSGLSPVLGDLCTQPPTLPPPSVSFDGEYTRTSITPSQCNQPSDCKFKCSAFYSISVNGYMATIRPKAVAGCGCEMLFATLSGTTGTGTGTGEAASFTFTRTATGIQTTAVVDGVSCTGTYSSSSSQASPATSATVTVVGTTSNVVTVATTTALGLALGVAVL